jgi:hypothetical protein
MDTVMGARWTAIRGARIKKVEEINDNDRAGKEKLRAKERRYAKRNLSRTNEAKERRIARQVLQMRPTPHKNKCRNRAIHPLNDAEIEGINALKEAAEDVHKLSEEAEVVEKDVHNLSEEAEVVEKERVGVMIEIVPKDSQELSESEAVAR